jgi:hypothetical protein
MTHPVLTDENRVRMILRPSDLDRYREQGLSVDELEELTNWYLVPAGRTEETGFRAHLGAAFDINGEFDQNFTSMCGRTNKQKEALLEEGAPIPGDVKICKKCEQHILRITPWSKQAARLARQI